MHSCAMSGRLTCWSEWHSSFSCLRLGSDRQALKWESCCLHSSFNHVEPGSLQTKCDINSYFRGASHTPIMANPVQEEPHQ